MTLTKEKIRVHAVELITIRQTLENIPVEVFDQVLSQVEWEHGVGVILDPTKYRAENYAGELDCQEDSSKLLIELKRVWGQLPCQVESRGPHCRVCNRKDYEECDK